MRTGLSGFALSRTELAVQIREPATPGRKAASAAFVHDDAASSKLTVNAIKKPGFYCPAFFRSSLLRPLHDLLGPARHIVKPWKLPALTGGKVLNGGDRQSVVEGNRGGVGVGDGGRLR